MRNIETIEVVRINAGKLKLTKEQASSRVHLISPIEDEDDCYEIKKTVIFKAGEKFGFEGEVKPISNKIRDIENGELMSDILLKEKIDVRAQELAESKIIQEKENNIIEEIILAIADLDPESDDDFTDAGLPQVKALEKILGYDITAAQRDEAFKHCQAESAE